MDETVDLAVSMLTVMSRRDDPSDEEYRPPPSRACEVDEFSIDVGTDADTGARCLLYYQARWYRKKVVWFCIELCLATGRGRGADQRKIFRVDTDHGVVHIHQYHRSTGRDARTDLVTIPPAGHDVVDGEHQSWWDKLLTEEHWREVLRRWNTS